MSREIEQNLIEATGVEALQRGPGNGMELGARAMQEGVVSDVTYEWLRERDPDVGKDVAFVQELERDELGDVGAGALAARGDRLEVREGKLAPENGAPLERSLERLAETIDARGEKVVNRLRHRGRRGWRARSGRLAKIEGELLEKERVAFGALHDEVARADLVARQ